MNCPTLTESILTGEQRKFMTLDIDDHTLTLMWGDKPIARWNATNPSLTQSVIREEANKFMKCPVCGATENLAVHYGHVGGQGEVPILQCKDETECWNSYNKQHRLSEEGNDKLSHNGK